MKAGDRLGSYEFVALIGRRSELRAENGPLVLALRIEAIVGAGLIGSIS
jgi:hypothetical protein